MTNELLKVFIGTSWDLYFLWYEKYSRTAATSKLNNDIHQFLGFFFEQQNCLMPDISDMVRELCCYHNIPTDVFSCEQKMAFIEKYSKEFKY